MEQDKIIIRGGVYLARLDPAKASEIGKIRPVVVLNAQFYIDANPPLLLICPLSSKSRSAFEGLHTKIFPRDNLLVSSYALVEHVRSISIRRIIYPKLAQLDSLEIKAILHKLKILVDD